MVMVSVRFVQSRSKFLYRFLGIVAFMVVAFLLLPSSEIDHGLIGYDGHWTLHNSEERHQVSCYDHNRMETPPEHRQRAPRAIVMGAANAGSEQLSRYLWQHPQIAKPDGKPELHFFYDPQNEPPKAAHEYVGSKETSESYYKKMKAVHPNIMDEIMKNNNLIFVENSPSYLASADVVASRITCTFPWVLLLCVLKNPIDRAYTHYQRWTAKNDVHITFEEFIEMDMIALEQSGLVRNRTKAEWASFYGTHQERDLWYEYRQYCKQKQYNLKGRVVTNPMPLGRGLYSLQIDFLHEALKVAGKSSKDLLVVNADAIETEPQDVMDMVYKFLKLPAANIEAAIIPQANPINAETRKQLEHFFQPFNNHLYQVLGDEWKGAFDVTTRP